MQQHRLFQYLNQFITLSGEELSLIIEKLEVRRFNAGEMILNAGEKETYLNFVEKGIAIKYFMRGKEEVVRQLAKENDTLASAVSFIASSPSQYCIEALEPCMFLSIRKDVFETLYRYSPRFEKLGRLLFTDWMLQTEIWEYERISLTPRQRFTKFIKENPELLKRVPQKLIASFLDIKPETFSRYKYSLNSN
jgi:signal-transduction protein with cAMP-binding, CBS, and nucleotidyltransferase domain